MARDEIKLMIHSLNQTSRAALWSFLVARDRLHYGPSWLHGTGCLVLVSPGGVLAPKHSGPTCL